MPDRLAAADFDKIEALETFAAERDLEILDVAIGGLAAQPAVVSVIAGATRPEQVAENVRAGAWDPTAEDLAALDDLT
jgi:aryl-alcohol dehydrogenase-like predicted oxidoreductase